MDQRVYIRKISQAEGFNVWLVDGKYVRKNFNENFVGYSSHVWLAMIPRREFWIDQEMHPAEYDFFIARLLTESKLISQGLQKQAALAQAAAAEKLQRQNQLNGNARLSKNKTRALTAIRKKMLPKFSGKVAVWLVDGRLVRDLYDVDFFEGGHDLVYSYVPRREIWIEQTLSPEEQGFVILHELHERYLMSKGRNYARAHHGATIVEAYHRHHPEKLAERTLIEIDKNNKAGLPETFQYIA